MDVGKDREKDEWQNSNNNAAIGVIPMVETSSSACSSASMVDTFCWDQGLGFCDVNAMLRGGMLPPQNLPHFPADSAFAERAARFSCFGEMLSPFSVPDPRALGTVFQGPVKSVEKVNGSSDEAEFSGRGSPLNSASSSGKKKRKREGSLNDVNNDPSAVEAGKEGIEIAQKSDQNAKKKGGSQGSDAPKEDYIHVRARRGQATNSHSLAERVRREKISERMKFLQDLVPGCSKVTGKAVMLDEIINYVQSLQRQVEFLSMKLATVNPRLDFNIEGLLNKDILQPGPVMSSLSLTPEMAMHFPSFHQPQPRLIHPATSAEALRRPINLQSPAALGFKQHTSQIWDDELHNIVHMGFNSSPLNTQDSSGCLPPGHIKAEP